MTIEPGNQLLAALPERDYKRLLPNLQRVFLESEQVLYQSDRPIAEVYFPERAVVSKLIILDDGSSVEVGMVGREGMLGICAFLTTDVAPYRTVVQAAGPAQKMEVNLFLQEVARSGNEVQHLLRRYAASYLAQVSHLAACNQFHSVKNRCCRMLLSTADRLGSHEISLTQEFLAVLLGVRRASVGDVMGELKDEGLLTYTRGQITLRDQRGLESCACECYGRIRDAARKVVNVKV